MASNDPDYQKRYIKKHYQENKQYYIQKEKVRRAKLSTEQRLFEAIRTRARNSKIPFDIEVHDIIIPSICPILKIPFIDKHKLYGPSVDRFIPEKGYVKGNIAVISRRANTIKNNASFDEIEALYLWMKDLSS